MAVNGQRGDGVTQLVVSSASSLKSPSLGTPPSNEVTELATQLVHKLSVTDVRFDLCFNYGPLLRELPKRLGQSEALDAAAVTLVATVDDLERATLADGRLGMYGRALYKLRASLLNPEMAFSSLTLCAIFVVWICQGWIGGDQSDAPGHGAGVLQLLSNSPLRHSRDPFEQHLLAVMLAPVVRCGNLTSRTLAYFHADVRGRIRLYSEVGSMDGRGPDRRAQ